MKRKDIIALFKSKGLSITIDTNLIETDFLDVSFNLETDKFFPFREPSNTPLYIHSRSNHPPSIIKLLPSMTNKRISNLSSNEHEFKRAKTLYESALKSSGFNYSIKFKAPVENARRNRNRKVIWLNPPYSLNVKTNIRKVFLKLVRKYFPRSHKLNKIFNLNSINPILDGLFLRCSRMVGGGGGGGRGTKRFSLPKICHTYPRMMKLGTVIPYPKKTQKIYESRDTTLEFC